VLDILLDNHRVLLDGALMTLQVSLAAIGIGMVLGLALAFGLRSRRAAVARACAAYRSLWRGTPILIQLLLMAELLPLLGLGTSPMVPAIAALALNTAAFQAEIYRSGLAVIPPGQAEAARMLGIPPGHVRRRILVPQMFRLVMPALVNEIITILKNSSLVSVIAVTELMRVSQQIASTTFRPLESYLAAGVLYLAMNLCIARAGVLAERRLGRGLAE